MKAQCKRPGLSLAVWLAALLLAVFAVACGDDEGDGGAADTAAAESTGAEATEAEAPEARTIEVNFYSRELPYFQDLVAGMEASAGELGWTITKTFGKTDPQLQFTQLENAIVKQPDGIILAPVDEQAVTPAIRKAKEADIAVVTVADNLGEDGQEAQLAYVGHEYESLGRQKAEWIAEELGGKGKVAIIHGIRGLNFTEEQGRGAAAAFKEFPDIEVINGPYTGAFSTDKGLEAAQNVLTKDPDVDALYFDNDDIALGGVQAVEERGISFDDILIIGTDGGKPALDAVKEGKLDYTVSLCGFFQGAKAIEVMAAFLNDGTEPDKFVETKTEVFTTEDVEDKLSSLAREDC